MLDMRVLIVGLGIVVVACRGSREGWVERTTIGFCLYLDFLAVSWIG